MAANRWQIAEKFKSLQGEGSYAGTPMAFIRFIGCSVGKRVCHHCDTDFDAAMPWRGGGEFTAGELLGWVGNYRDICLTGGEPLDQNLDELLELSRNCGKRVHIETSGTVAHPNWLSIYRPYVWICCSPKPGYLPSVVEDADEVKVIVPGLGNGEGWPTLENALRWAYDGKRVYLQPRNAKFDVDKQNLLYVQDIIRDHPELRLSVQLHKLLKVQ
jgi:7-carboxy-7-deazaguanine synthase